MVRFLYLDSSFFSLYFSMISSRNPPFDIAIHDILSVNVKQWKNTNSEKKVIKASQYAEEISLAMTILENA